jgi:hypothetical protein
MHFILKIRNLLTFIYMLVFFSAVQIQAAANYDNSVALVERCYQNILGKTIKSGPLTHWLRILDDSSAKEVTLGFFSTKQYDQLELTNTQFIETLYLTLLDRDPMAAESEALLSRLNAGESRDSVISDLLDSQEFSTLYLTENSSDESSSNSSSVSSSSSSNSSSVSSSSSSNSSSVSSSSSSNSSSVSSSSSSAQVCESGPASHEGKVTDGTTGKPLANVEVNIGGCKTTTDSQGFYKFTNIATSDRAVVNFSKDGYCSGSAIIIIEQYLENTTDLSSNFLEYSIDIYDSEWSYDGQTEFVSAHVDIPVGILADKAGNTYYGTVTARQKTLDATTDVGKMLFPGAFEGSNAYGDTVLFGSYGMISLSLEDSTGGELNIEAGAVVTLTFDAVVSLQQYSVIPLWYYDYDLGLWIEEGYAERQTDGTYKGEISRLGTWSINVPLENAPGTYRGRISYQAENTAKDLRVYAVGPNWIRADLSTNADGNFEIKVIPGNDFQLKAYDYRLKYGAKYNGTISAVASGEIVE